MKKFVSGKRAAVLAAVAVVALAASAYAYWNTNGSGTGSARTGKTVPVTITQLGQVADLAPGSGPQPVNFKITNPAGNPQFIRNVTLGIGTIEKAGVVVPETDCSAADFALDQPTPIRTDIPAGDTEFKSQGGALRMVNRDVQQNGCKSVTVNLTFDAN
jgi:hypothetical protein